MSHGDTITTLPDGFEIITSTDDVQVAGYQITKEKRVGEMATPAKATVIASLLLPAPALSPLHAS